MNIYTLSGMINVIDPDPQDIHLEDIARALANTSRWAGHTPHYYSVAEHSIRVAMLVEPHHKLQALLHDAAEAYLGDIPTPIKRLLQFRTQDANGVTVASFGAVETNLLGMVLRKYAGCNALHQTVHEADRMVLEWERVDLLDGTHVGMTPDQAWQAWLGVAAPLVVRAAA